MATKEPAFLREMWHCLGEDPALLERVPPGGYPVLPSVFDTSGLVRDAVAAAALSAALLADRVAPRADGSARPITLDSAQITTAVTSASHFRLNGQAPDVWAEFSGFWQARDGWVRTHANYPHHRARLLEALGLDAAIDRPAFEQRIATLPAREIERRAAEKGAVAVAVRDLHEWAAHPQAVTVSAEPLIRMSSPAPAPRREWRRGRADAPLAGIRVLDLTRVIAGPTATQTLALLGADVLRVDSPRLPEIAWQHFDTGAGKRSTLLDLTVASDRCTFEDLLAGADVVVTGYRSQALARFGLDSLSEGVTGPAGPRVGRVVARLGAWGCSGPWAGRRGFDSIVQAASGIAWAQTADGRRPGVLPAQALDHSAGFLLAAGIISALRKQSEAGGSWLLEISLARIAGALLQTSGLAHAADDAESRPTTREYSGPAGVITGARPAVQYQDGPDDWPQPARPWGGDPARWAD